METPVEFSPPWPEREQFYVGVGLAISRWSNIETTIVQICSVLMGTEEKKGGIVLYSIMNFNTRLMIMSELFAIDPNFQEHANSWNKKAKRLRALNDTRVRLAHHTVWESNDASDFGLKPSRLDARSKSLAYKPLTVTEIEVFVDTVFTLHRELTNLQRALLKRTPIDYSSRDKDQPPQDGQPPSDAQ